MAKLNVKAREKGYFGGLIREEGAKFTLTDPSQFSHVWMVAIGWQPPARRRPASAVDAEDDAPELASFKAAKAVYSEGEIEVSLEDAMARAIDDEDLSMAEWNGLPDNRRKLLTMAAVKAIISEEQELREDEDSEEDDSEEDDEE